MELEIKLIRTDGGTQARAALDSDTVEEYRAAFRNSDSDSGPDWPFPPVIVFYDGNDHWLADGFHRVEAAKIYGRFIAEADVRQGTQRDAVLFAVGANADHGLRRTTDDKRRAVMRLLEDAEWGGWSDREIARRCKVSHPFVAGLRPVTGNVTSERTYTDKHGNQAVMNTTAIGSGNRIEIDKGRAYDWLRDYEDDKDRTWQDLEDNQVHHANSPCYQAYVRAFPDQADPKLYLKNALARLQREAGETAVLNELTQNDLLEKAAAWLTGKPDGGLSAFVHFLDLEGTPYTLQYARDAFAEAKAQDKAETAVSPAVAAYTRSEVRHAIAEANRNARFYFMGSPASFYHGWAEQGEAHPQYHFMRTATAQFPADLVTEELAALCQCNPLETAVSSEVPATAVAGRDPAYATVSELEESIMVWYISQRLNDIPRQLALMLEISAETDRHSLWGDMIGAIKKEFYLVDVLSAIDNLVAYLQLRADELKETAGSSDEPGLEIWEIEKLVRRWHETRPPIRADALYNLEYFCDWLERNNHNARRNYAKQALNNVKFRNQRKEETAVSDPDAFLDRAIATEAAEIEEIFPAKADVSFDYLKQAENALGRAVSTFDITRSRALFFKINDTYNRLLHAVQEYEMTP